MRSVAELEVLDDAGAGSGEVFRTSLSSFSTHLFCPPFVDQHRDRSAPRSHRQLHFAFLGYPATISGEYRASEADRSPCWILAEKRRLLAPCPPRFAMILRPVSRCRPSDRRPRSGGGIDWCSARRVIEPLWHHWLEHLLHVSRSICLFSRRGCVCRDNMVRFARFSVPVLTFTGFSSDAPKQDSFRTQPAVVDRWSRTIGIGMSSVVSLVASRTSTLDRRRRRNHAHGITPIAGDAVI